MSDYDRIVAGAAEPFYRIPDGKTQIKYKQQDIDKDVYSPSCYVQHIGAGHGKYYNYAKLYERMKSVGFDILRSPRGKDDKIWEIWYLPGTWALEGELNKNDKKQLIQWLIDNISPGTITFNGEQYALTFE
jgi:hypothetical protein